MSVVNLTALRMEVAPPWVEDPAGRGTWSLLYSCTFTLGICVWTSIHLNVPPKESSWKSWRRKLKWLFVALFAPEIVVFTAFQQWLTAKLFLKELIKISDANTSKDLEGGEESEPKRKFDMTYAFYATMGGFAVDIEHLHNTVKQGTLTTKGLLFLADQGQFFEISAESISDKSKANLLAKVLVCLQVLWAAGQTIERKIASYPISLIEFHTLVHVFCALVMYTLWLRKPYDVGNPTMVSPDIDDGILAFIVASSRWNGRSGFLKGRSEANWVDRLMKIRKDPKFIYYGALAQSPQVIPMRTGCKHTRLDNMEDSRLKNHIVVADVRATQSTINPQRTYYADWNFGRDYTVTYGVQSTLRLWNGQALCSGFGPSELDGNKYPLHLAKGCRVELSDKDLAGAFLNDTFLLTDESRSSEVPLPPEGAYPVNKPFDPFDNRALNRHGRRLICYREENILLESGELLQNTDGSIWEFYLLVLAMTLIPAAYGGIHLSALSEMFPTPLESILWKASCFILIGFAVLLLLFIAAMILSTVAEGWANEFFDTHVSVSVCKVAVVRFCQRVGPDAEYYFFVGNACLILVAAPLYTGARVFLVLEAFISLRHVPIGVYQAPPTNFMSYIPHL